MIEKILKKAGFADKEILVYLAGLKEGPVLANFLSHKTGVSRQNTYDLLRKLIKKGLVTSTGKKYNTRFVMEDPVNIIRLLDKRKGEIEKTKKEFELALPELESIYKTDQFVPKIKFYEGEESMKNLFLDSLKCKDKEILAMIPSADLYETLGKDFTKEFVEKRVKEKVRTKTIRLSSREEYGDEFFHKHKEQLREIRYAPKDMSFKSTFFLYDSKVVFISSKKENFGLLIDSEEYKEMMNSLFNAIWKLSK